VSSANLLDFVFTLKKPVIMVLEGGRPFSVPEYYSQAAAVINAVTAIKFRVFSFIY
jgi:hypothetical protein